MVFFVYTFLLATPLRKFIFLSSEFQAHLFLTGQTTHSRHINLEPITSPDLIYTQNQNIDFSTPLDKLFLQNKEQEQCYLKPYGNN